jgi:hypothetical protein
MKKLVLTMVVAMSGNLFAVDSVKIDRGVVNIQLETSEKAYNLKYKKTPECQAEIIVKESGSTVQVVHARGYCPSGATFTLTVNPMMVKEVFVDAGVVKVLNTDLLMNEQINTKAVVNAGVVECNKRVFQHKIINYAGQEATKDFGSEKSFFVHVDAGVLHL